LATDDTKWCCKYEYLRESKGLREGLANPRRESAPAVSCADWIDNARLVFALLKAGYPAPWNKLDVKSKEDLTQVLSWNSKNQERHPVFMAQEFEPGHDPDERGRLVEQWKESAYYDAAPDHNYFFGLFRLDETYNETDAVKTFGTWFSERRERTKSGGSPHWQAKLNDLVVMRLWNRLPRREDAIKRVEHVANYTTTGFAGCKAFKDDRQNARREKREVEQRTSKAAIEEMSRACGDALKFFQTFFPGEKPLSCPRRTLAATKKRMKTS
jgi:hypothetical protein